MKKWLPDVFIALFLFIGLLMMDLIIYGVSMGYGQFSIIYYSQPVSSYVTQPNVTSTQKEKLILIGRIKKFTQDSLGFAPSNNYTSVYDHGDKPLMWVITASEKYSLTPHYWTFPVAGKVTYKGFFSQELAEIEKQELIQKGYDVKIRLVNAWSTLGWFNDPVMIGFLEYDPGELCNLIIHELSHSTIYVKGNTEYNENLASFIGDRGATYFLSAFYGYDSNEYSEYQKNRYDEKLFTSYMIKSSNQLDSLYKLHSFIKSPEYKKEIFKNQLIRKIINQGLLLPFKDGQKYKKWLMKTELNNAGFIVFKQYNDQIDVFEKEYNQCCGGNIKKYIGFLKQKFNEQKL